MKRPITLNPVHGAVAALILLALIWGYNWVVMKIGLRYSQPFTFAALRTFLGALVLIGLLAVLRRQRAINTSDSPATETVT